MRFRRSSATDGSRWTSAPTRPPGRSSSAVGDNGPGVPGEKRSAIFEPFFTTKSEGSGLGLWIVQQIATAHGGLVTVENRPGGGAAFTLRLPLANGPRRIPDSWIDQRSTSSWSTTSGACARACRRRCGARATWSTRPTTPAARSELLGGRLYNLVLSDVRMPEMSGLELLKEARQKSRDTLFILMTAYGTVPNAVEAMKEGAYDYLTKPLDMQRLRALVLKALEFQSVVSENTELRQRLRKRSEPSLLVGDSEAIRKVIRMAEEVARSEVTVLIEGESGTGKELVARMIHAHSARADKPFIFVNCAALSEQLLEAELFGHMKGAFTGAVASKPGRFQLADGGTLVPR